MARTKKELTNQWPAWRYGPSGESAIFQTEDEVPFGWTKKAGQVFEPKAAPIIVDRQLLIDLLIVQGITPNPTWSAAHMKELLRND